MSKRPSYYDILNVPPSSGDEEIKRAYLDLAKKFHPDRAPDKRSRNEQFFRLIGEAYDGIKTRERRAEYNESLRQVGVKNDNVKPRERKGLFEYIGGILRPKPIEQKKHK